MYWHVAPCVLFVSCITHSLIHHPASKYKEAFFCFSNRILSHTPKTRLNQQAMIANSRASTGEQTRLVRKRARDSTDQSIRQSVRGSSSGAVENPLTLYSSLASPHSMIRVSFKSFHTKCKPLVDVTTHVMATTSKESCSRYSPSPSPSHPPPSILLVTNILIETYLYLWLTTIWGFVRIYLVNVLWHVNRHYFTHERHFTLDSMKRRI